MKTTSLILAAALLGATRFASAHTPDVHLHVNPKWKECSFQIDPSLTQKEWHQFAKEAGLVSYFRPLTDARSMGRGKFEISVLQWNTGIDETDGAWNNTFVHPDSTHWLVGDDDLPFPGLTLRAGITKNIDAGIYWSERPGANYGVMGAQVQYNFLNDTSRHWAASARVTFSSLYGPEDLNLRVYGTDFLASKEFRLYSHWLSISPYAGFSTYLSHTHEKTEVVNLKDENRFGVQGLAGAVAKISVVRLGVEYNLASVHTFSYKLGIAVNFNRKSR